MKEFFKKHWENGNIHKYLCMFVIGGLLGCVAFSIVNKEWSDVLCNSLWVVAMIVAYSIQRDNIAYSGIVKILVQSNHELGEAMRKLLDGKDAEEKDALNFDSMHELGFKIQSYHDRDGEQWAVGILNTDEKHRLELNPDVNDQYCDSFMLTAYGYGSSLVQVRNITSLTMLKDLMETLSVLSGQKKVRKNRVSNGVR